MKRSRRWSRSALVSLITALFAATPALAGPLICDHFLQLDPEQRRAYALGLCDGLSGTSAAVAQGLRHDILLSGELAAPEPYNTAEFASWHNDIAAINEGQSESCYVAEHSRRLDGGCSSPHRVAAPVVSVAIQDALATARRYRDQRSNEAVEHRDSHTPGQNLSDTPRFHYSRVACGEFLQWPEDRRAVYLSGLAAGTTGIAGLLRERLVKMYAVPPAAPSECLLELAEMWDRKLAQIIERTANGSWLANAVTVTGDRCRNGVTAFESGEYVYEVVERDGGGFTREVAGGVAGPEFARCEPRGGDDFYPAEELSPSSEEDSYPAGELLPDTDNVGAGGE